MARINLPAKPTVVALLAAVAIAVLALGTTGITSPAPSRGAMPSSAAAWLVDQRPPGAVVTVEGWQGVVEGLPADFRVVAAPDAEIADLAHDQDVGSAIVPSPSAELSALLEDPDWMTGIDQDGAAVLVHAGAEATPGAP